MTDEQIEAAARRLCKIRGVDPDKGVSPVDGLDPNIVEPGSVPRWKWVSREVRANLEVRQAIRDARAEEGRKYVGVTIDQWRDE